MKAEKKLSIALAALMVAGALPVAVAADDTTEMVYGTMTIPYAEFYRGEGVDYDVDVVTSATASEVEEREPRRRNLFARGGEGRSHRRRRLPCRCSEGRRCFDR